jgi:hypothetical protein
MQWCRLYWIATISWPLRATTREDFLFESLRATGIWVKADVVPDMDSFLRRIDVLMMSRLSKSNRDQTNPQTSAASLSTVGN